MIFQPERRLMVQEQLIKRGINDRGVLEAFYKVERHCFVPDVSRASSYADFPLPIGKGQTISQPYMVALMTECLKLSKDDTVLEIGTGSGYQTAILAQIAKYVYSIERIESLAKQAEIILKQLGYSNVLVKVGDGTQGYPEKAPFDKIMVTAASPHIPKPLIEQLDQEARLVIPIGESYSQILSVVKKTGDKITTEEVCSCVFVPLIGKYGYANSPH
jgi:protein-L-isoaspartate(D-aspartate) O-methyltransferase